MSESDHSGISSALDPAALRAALVPQRPVFANPWDSTEDMFACYFAVSFFDPLLLWAGGKLMGAIFGFGTHWPLGVFLVGVELMVTAVALPSILQSLNGSINAFVGPFAASLTASTTQADGSVQVQLVIETCDVAGCAHDGAEALARTRASALGGS